MNIEYYPIDKLRQEIKSIIGKYLDLSIYRVFFFGSRVAGNNNERSDIDIGIEGPSEIPSNILFNIKEEVEEIPTLYKIEIVDFRRVSPGFHSVSLQFTEIIV